MKAIKWVPPVAVRQVLAAIDQMGFEGSYVAWTFQRAFGDPRVVDQVAAL